MSILKKIDEVAKGVKQYLLGGTGVMVVAALQSQGVDAVGLVDYIQVAINDTVTQVAAVWATLQVTFRKAMPDKRGS